MLSTGTLGTGSDLLGSLRGAFDAYPYPVCYVDYPDFTTADIQDSVQYLVFGLRKMARVAGRPVAVYGISQGALLPRVALTYWPGLRRKVTDVIGVAGTHRGTAVDLGLVCSSDRLCPPAFLQQAAGSNFLKALNRQPDESPGKTSWTTVRTLDDELVQPQTGDHPTSALQGAANLVIQEVCPGRHTSHIGAVYDSVSFAALVDAVAHRGPARASRLPGDVCSHKYATGLRRGADGCDAGSEPRRAARPCTPCSEGGAGAAGARVGQAGTVARPKPFRPARRSPATSPTPQARRLRGPRRDRNRPSSGQPSPRRASRHGSPSTKRSRAARRSPRQRSGPGRIPDRDSPT